MIILNLIRGMFMAFADSVPGVSGGTVAFVMGFYNEFIGAINTLVSSGSLSKKKEALVFLIKIGVGWIVGMIISVLFISSIFERQIYEISSLFVGFILFSIPIVLREEKNHLSSNYKHLVFVFLGMVIVSLITYFNPTSAGAITNITAAHFSPGLVLYIFVAGAVAISAMILPGISGSTLLLIFGLYTPIISALKHFILLDFTYLPILIIFGLGILFGVMTTIKLINHLLQTKRSQVIYLILGLMIGSLYAVFMGATTLEIPMAPMGFDTFSFIFFIIGGLVILGLDNLKLFLKK